MGFRRIAIDASGLERRDVRSVGRTRRRRVQRIRHRSDDERVLAPRPDRHGAVTISVSDGLSSATDSFHADRIPVNDAPTIRIFSGPLAIVSGAAVGPTTVVLSDPDSNISAATVTIESSNAAIVAPEGLTLAGTGLVRTLTIQTQPSVTGTSNDHVDDVRLTTHGQRIADDHGDAFCAARSHRGRRWPARHACLERARRWWSGRRVPRRSPAGRYH